jgi:RNA polymerase sigma-70 factor, ECF subfamily
VTVLQDEEIVRLVIDGHTQAYSILVDKYKNMIFDLCYKYTYDYTEAQDLSQDIFIKAYRKLYTFKNSSSFSTWFYRIGINTCIDWTRKKKKQKNMNVVDEDGYLEVLPSNDPALEDIVIDKEKRQLVRNAISNMSEKYKTVVILYNYKNLSCMEISQILDVPVKTVETRLYRAKKILKNKLLESFNGGEYLWNAAK